MPRQSRLSGRAFWGLASWALPLVIVFVVSPKLLHLLGAERFGVLMIALVTPLIAAQLDFGIASSGVRKIAAITVRGQIEASTTLFTLFAVLTVIGVVLGACLWFGAGPVANLIGFSKTLGSDEGAHLVQMCSVWTALSLATLPAGIAARAVQSFQLIAVLQTLNTLLLWLAALLLLSSGRAIYEVVAVAMGLGITTSLVTVVSIRQHISWTGYPRFEAGFLKNEWRFSAGMFAAQAAGAIVYQADRILVSTFGSPAIAGLYSISTGVANKTSSAVSALTSFVFPHAAHLNSSNQRDSLAGLLHALDRAIAVLVIPLLLPAVFLAGSFLVLWLGSYATEEVVIAFRLLVVAFAVPSFAVPISSILAGTGDSALPARFAWLTVSVIVLGLALLVPRHGLIGAAVAMLLANSTSFLFSAIGRRSLGLPPAAGAARFWAGICLGALAQMALLLWLASTVTTWVALLTVGGVAWAVFYGVRVIVGALSIEERELLGRARDRLAAVLPR